MKKMDRRGFLELVPKAAVGLALTGAGVIGSQELKQKEEERITGVNKAIEEFLGLKEGQSTIDFNFTNHVLVPVAEQRIIDTKATVILGELNQYETQKQYLLDFIEELNSGRNILNTEELFSLGIGASKEETITHCKILLSMLADESKQLVATDPKTGFIESEEGNIRDLLAKKEMPIAIGVGAISLVTIFSYIDAIKNQRKISRRTALKHIILTAMGVAAATPIGNFIRLNTSDRGELRNNFVPLLSSIDTPDRKNEHIYKPDKDNPWISHSEMLGQFRNAAMALNTWSTLAKRSGKKDHLEKAFFFAATAHTDSRNIFLKGPENAEKIMELFAQTLLTQSIPLLMQKSETLKDENGMLLSYTDEQKELWVMGNLLEYSKSFLEPTAIGPQESNLLEKEEEPSVYPRTQKSVFIDILRDSILENKNDPVKLKILISLLNRLEDEILTNGTSIDTTKSKSIEVKVGRTIFDPSSGDREKSIKRKLNALKSVISDTDTLLKNENRVLEGGALISPDDIFEGTTMKYIDEEKMFLGIERFRGSDVPIFRTSHETFYGDNIGNNKDERIHFDYTVIEGIPVIIRKFLFKKLKHQEYTNYIYGSQTPPTTVTLLDNRARNNTSIIKGRPFVISTNRNMHSLTGYPNTENAEVWMLTNESDEDPLGITQLIITE